LFWENRIFAILLVAKTQKKIKPVVVKVELRQKRQQKNRVLPPLPIELAKTGRFTTPPSMSEMAIVRQTTGIQTSSWSRDYVAGFEKIASRLSKKVVCLASLAKTPHDEPHA